MVTFYSFIGRGHHHHDKNRKILGYKAPKPSADASNDLIASSVEPLSIFKSYLFSEGGLRRLPF